jgi:hypothetical protein
MAQTVADLKVRFGADGVDTVEQAAARANKSVTGIGSSLKGVAQVAGGFLAARAITAGAQAIRGQVSGAIDAASDLDESLNKNSVIFGDNAAAVQKWAQGAASNLGISRQQALETTATFGNLLKGAGVANKDLPKMSEHIVQAASDLASFNNASPEDTLQAIQSGIVGEVEPLRKYGILLSEAAVQQEAMSETGKTNAKELTNGEKAAARYNLIMKQLGDAQGDFQRTSKGLANQERILAARRKDVAATIGKLLLPAQLAWTRAQLSMLGVVERAIPALGRFLSPVADLARIMSAAFTGRWAGFNKIVNELPEPLQRSGHALGVMVEGFADLFSFMRQGDWDRFVTRLPGELRQIAGGFEALGEELLQGATWVANIVIDTVVTIAGWLWDHRGDLWGGIKALVGWSVSTIVEAISWTVDVGVPTVIGWVTGIAGRLGDWLLGVIYGASGDGTGGPQPHGSTIVMLAGWTLNVAVPTLIGWTADAVAWFRQEVQAKFRGLTVDTPAWTLNVTLPTVTFSGGVGFGFALGQKIRAGIDAITIADFTNWKILVGVPAAIALGPLTLVALGTKFLSSLTGVSVTDFTKWALTMGVPATIGVVAGIAAGISPTLTQKFVDASIAVDNFTDWALNLAAPKLAWAAGFDPGQIVTWILDHTSGISISDAFKWALKLVTPDLSLGFTAETLAGQIAAKVATLDVGDIPFHFKLNLIPDVFGSGSQSGGPAGGDPGLGGGGGGGGLLRTFFAPQGGGGFDPSSLLAGFTIPAPKDDASPVIDSVRKALEGLTSATWMPTLDLNPRPLLEKLTSATLAGSAFAALTWIPTLDANDTPFSVAVAAAAGLGKLFAATTFTATLAGDTGPFSSAVASAAGLGALFASTTYTASLDADTGPFWRAVNGILGTTLGTAYVTLAAANTIDPAASVKGRAGGGLVTEPFTLVGERGPELVSLPRGSFVHTAAATRGMLGPASITINVNGSGNPEAVARAVHRELARELTLMPGVA